jgi:hypothetical protein
MQIKPSPPRPELDALIEEAKRKLAAMTLEEREAHFDAQKKNWVRAEMSWPRDCPYR